MPSFDRDVAVEFFFKGCEQHKLNPVHLRCVGPVAENPEMHISKPKQIKLPAWQDTISDKWENMDLFSVCVILVNQPFKSDRRDSLRNE